MDYCFIVLQPIEQLDLDISFLLWYPLLQTASLSINTFPCIMKTEESSHTPNKYEYNMYFHWIPCSYC